jgi:tryptophan synthase alpha chain
MSKKLVAYVTSSFPDKEFTKDLILSMKEAGADKIELGIPFSDPVADGPVIEKANLQALENGFKVNDIFDISNSVAKEIDTYWMGYFNNFYHKGYEFMTQKAKESGVKGFIIPDLPYEETLIYKDKHPLISFVAPTDSKERINLITKDAQEFIYMVAYAGITGSGKSEDLTEIISNVRESSQKELFIGFGVNENTAKEKSKGVDGVIVGSAFINILLQDLTHSEKIAKITALCKNIKESINS